jgi:hypothetical protein
MNTTQHLQQAMISKFNIPLGSKMKNDVIGLLNGIDIRIMNLQVPKSMGF